MTFILGVLINPCVMASYVKSHCSFINESVVNSDSIRAVETVALTYPVFLRSRPINIETTSLELKISSAIISGSLISNSLQTHRAQATSK